MVELRLVPAERNYVGEIGRICFESFRDIHDRHLFPRDLPGVEIATKVVGMLVERDDYYGVVALLDGKPAGSNFLSLMDPVAGLGPITVDPGCQARGVGRALMEDVIDYARRNNIDQLRLLQDSFNMSSLSLYASLGFEVREPVVLMQAPKASQSRDNVRLLEEADLDDVDSLCRGIYKVSRRNEVAAAIAFGFSPLLIEREGRITGYLIRGFFGHGVYETEDDATALVSEVSHRLTPDVARFFCPLREASLYRRLLKEGCRAIKVMNLMAIGPYEAPDEFWMPSIFY
jgi:GNAT superfamily N-acetyltransferase